jgi:hypothetical protein
MASTFAINERLTACRSFAMSAASPIRDLQTAALTRAQPFDAYIDLLHPSTFLLFITQSFFIPPKQTSKKFMSALVLFSVSKTALYSIMFF